MLVTICVLVALPILVVGVHLGKHSQLRRGILFDRQNLFHSSDAFHVVSALKLKPGQELLEGVGRYVRGVEQQGAEVIYAGKVAFPMPRKSKQMPDLEWEAFVVSQYATRERLGNCRGKRALYGPQERIHPRLVTRHGTQSNTKPRCVLRYVAETNSPPLLWRPRDLSIPAC